MSLWWAKREQLDKHQVELIENLPLRDSFLVVGPPGCGKTNVLLRRAQFVRTQQMPNVLVLTFTRPLTEFIRTGCSDSQGREIFPRSCVTTFESWIRYLYRANATTPPDHEDMVERKRGLAAGAMGFVASGRIPKYDALFIDEAQDLLQEEIDLIRQWSEILFFVGDSNQRIYQGTAGLAGVQKIVSETKELNFHYRMAKEICEMADRILVAPGQHKLAELLYTAARNPGRIELSGPISRDQTMTAATTRLTDQVRAYADLIEQGDRLGIIVARKADRDVALQHLERDELLRGKAQIVRAKNDETERDFDPTLDPDKPIYILTVQGCKGLEFRAAHWLFAEQLQMYHNDEHYYTVVTRAKTSLDIYYSGHCPQTLAKAAAPPPGNIWS